MGRDTTIADRLRNAGLKVLEVDGWRTRGYDTFNPRGSVNHHTAGSASGNAPSLGICINGRAGLPGPLCNVFQARDNTLYVVAAGKANHAGEGGWRGLTGNSSVYGLEVENVGTTAEPWRADQLDVMARCHAALIRGKAEPSMVCQHKEWAPTRKSDAHDINGNDFRGAVARHLVGPPQPQPIMEDQMKLVTFQGSGGVWVSNGMFKFLLATPAELNSVVSNKIVDDSTIHVLDQTLVERLVDVNNLLAESKNDGNVQFDPAMATIVAEAVADEEFRRMQD